jgi:hypothetical protein
MVQFIFVVSDFKDYFLYPYGLMQFVTLVALADHFQHAGNDRSCKIDKTNVLIFCANIRCFFFFFESQYYINTV